MQGRDRSGTVMLIDALELRNTRINLIGVIVQFGFPLESKGSDHYSTLKIVDESLNERGLTVNLFEPKKDSLPKIASAGDIILLLNVKVVKWSGKGLTADTNTEELNFDSSELINAVYSACISTFALYEGKHCEDFIPYQRSRPRFFTREPDKRRIMDLRRWLTGYRLEERSLDFSLFRDIVEDKLCNLACKIVHSCETGQGHWIFLWDGTDMAPCTILSNLEDEACGLPPLSLEAFSLSRKTLRKFPSFGSVLRVLIDRGIRREVFRSFRTGEWVKFLDVLCKSEDGFWKGFFQSSSKVRHTTDEDGPILKRRRICDSRSSSTVERMPCWRPTPDPGLTDNSHQVPFATLMDVLTHPEVAFTCQCVVRVVAAYPWNISKFREYGLASCVILTLEDPTSRIRMLLGGRDWEAFFGDDCSDDVLIQKRNKLLGLSVDADLKETLDLPRRPPWIKCFAESYCTDRNNPWVTRRFRIFGTQIAD